MGTRVMPLTLHQPKGMIAIADKPMVHYVIDELIAAGIKEIILVVGPKQQSFKKYLNYLKQDKNWQSMKFRFIKQEKLLGNGAAVLLAKKFIKPAEMFLVAFCDELFVGAPPVLIQMLTLANQLNQTVVLTRKVPKQLVSRYGVLRFGRRRAGKFFSISGIVEKPEPDQAPSNFIIPGRYVLPFTLFDYLQKLYPPPSDQELYLTDALNLYLKDKHRMWGVNFTGLRFDCGSKQGLLAAQLFFTSHHPDIKSQSKRYSPLKNPKKLI